MGMAQLLGTNLFLFISSLLLPLLSAFDPQTPYFLSCGSSTSVLSSDKPPRNFTPDSFFLDPNSSSNSNPLTNPSPSPSSSPLHNTARVFTSTSSYRFEVASQGTYVLRLHFLPFSTKNYNLSAALFDVFALQYTPLLTDFSVGKMSTTPKEFLLWVDSDRLVVTFTPNNSFAFVNAIELFSAPSNLINASDLRYVTDTGITSVDQHSQRPMETVHRINIGGPLVTPANDTLWRTWLPDDHGYLYDENLSLVNTTAQKTIKYGTEPQRTPEAAPAIVYSTARTMNVPLTMRLGNPDFDFNLTWSFPVMVGGDYFVRMHFCDFVTDDVNELYFDVYLGSLLAYSDLQPGSLTHQTRAAAFFVDFAVNANSDLLNVSIGRSSKSKPLTVNALLNGLEIMKVLNLNPDSGTGRNSKGKIFLPILIGSILGGLIFISCLSCVFMFLCKRRRSKPAPEPQRSLISWSPFRGDGTDTVSLAAMSAEGTNSSVTPKTNLGLQISFAEIKLATEDFNDKNWIGSGGFGKVYKGVLLNGTRVAVKRSTRGSRQGYLEFRTEVLLLSRIRHRHLVSLIGYCEENSEKLLVYEYMEKGSLRSHLYGTDFPCLSWKQRLEICIGAARGLHYLHTGSSQCIIHRNVKSSNILLGDDYVAKVSDFELSKVGPSYGESHVSTTVKGSFGYLDPEYVKTGRLTEKSDVYSFGVLLFEVLCARRGIDPLATEQISLVEWALSWQRKGQLEKIIDQRLVGKINANSLKKFCETAEKCVAEYGIERPTMGDVLWSLEYALQLHDMELRRKPYDDSGGLLAQIPLAAVERTTSTSATTYGEKFGAPESSVGQSDSDMTTSSVFSQLIWDKGR